MSVRIDLSVCNGCGCVNEPRCVSVCPGGLLYKDGTNKCAVRDYRECWDCAACLKECPRQAISMYLPVKVGGRGATLKARTVKGVVHWLLTKPDGSTEEFKIQVRNDK